MGKTFKEEFKEESLEVVEDPQEANKNGFYKFSKAIAMNSKQKLKQA